MGRKQQEGTGSGSRTRTYDPRINSPLLYQLSYAGVLGLQTGAENSTAVYPGQGRRAVERPASRSDSRRRGSISASSSYSISITPRSPETIALQRFVYAER